MDAIRETSCYIVSRSGGDTAGLRRTLDELSMSALSAEQTPPVGESLPENLREMIQRADVVIGVLDADSDDENVLFELGVAVGLGKPLFLLVSPRRRISFSLQAVPQVKALPDDVEVIKFHLRQFVTSLGEHRPHSRPSKAAPIIRESASAEIMDIARRTGRESEAQLEEKILQALKVAGVATQSEPKFKIEKRGYRPDLVAWFPTAPASLGNPLVVELKANLLNSRRAAIDQAKAYLRATNLRTAIIIAARGANDVTFEYAEDGYVFVVPAEQFLAELAQGSLFETLVRRRNLAAHETHA
jgi:nucleoside 2-deoxyribosyltransferase